MDPNQENYQPVVKPGAALRPRIPGTPIHPTLTPELDAKHKESQARFPHLSLSAGEYVIEEVRRHPIGLLSIWFFVAVLSLIVLAVLPFYSLNLETIATTLMIPVQNLPSAAIVTIPALFLVALFALGGLIATIVYNGNKFYITSESIVQFIQISLFSTKQQVVNLINVEDASSEQANIVEQLLNYGTLKLSTQGEETTYHFRFVANPKRIVHAINDASERAVKILQGFPTTEY